MSRKIRLLEASLNFRMERGKDISDYSHSAEVAEEQKKYEPDIIVNVEDMDCEAAAYKNVLGEYNATEALEDKELRGISCYVKKEYAVEKIFSLSDPHLLHAKIIMEDDHINLVAFRILVAGRDAADFTDRKKQFNRVLKYIDELEDKHNLVLTGDWNHGVINPSGIYPEDRSRYHFNYHYIKEELAKRSIQLLEMEGFSYGCGSCKMRIDHLALKGDIDVIDARYEEAFEDRKEIGIPDHKFIVADLRLGE